MYLRIRWHWLRHFGTLEVLADSEADVDADSDADVLADSLALVDTLNDEIQKLLLRLNLK